jgi:membrane-associated phospholipid phosphatase
MPQEPLKPFQKRYVDKAHKQEVKPGVVKTLRVINAVLTGLFYAAFVFELAFLPFKYENGLVMSAIIAVVLGLSFVVVSTVRKKINEPRPYDLVGGNPLLPREEGGCSFPSRHAFSSFAIATSSMIISTQLEVSLIAAAVVLCLVRMIGGVHFPRDLIVGALIGAAVGYAAGVLAFLANWALL